jgi:hypothetical protein
MPKRKTTRKRKKPFGKLKKGQLHRDLHIPQGKKIPVSRLRAAAKRKGVVGRRARFALNARKFKH